MAEEGRTSVLRAVDYFEVTFVVGHTALLPESTRSTPLEYLKTVALFFTRNYSMISGIVPHLLSPQI